MRKYAREVAFSLVFEYMFTKALMKWSLKQFDKNNLTDEDLILSKAVQGSRRRVFRLGKQGGRAFKGL